MPSQWWGEVGGEGAAAHPADEEWSRRPLILPSRMYCLKICSECLTECWLKNCLKLWLVLQMEVNMQQSVLQTKSGCSISHCVCWQEVKVTCVMYLTTVNARKSGDGWPHWGKFLKSIACRKQCYPCVAASASMCTHCMQHLWQKYVPTHMCPLNPLSTSFFFAQ